jgi:hypothetical protein
MIDQIRFATAHPVERVAFERTGGNLDVVQQPEHIALSGNRAGRVAILADDRTFDVIAALHITRVRKLTSEEELK